MTAPSPPCRRPQRHGPDQAGLTLIEVMVGMLLVGILLLGTSTLWVVIAQQFDALTVRQQAIFRIDGEMSRLVELYSDENKTVTTVSVTDYASAAPVSIASYLAAPSSRLIHDAGGTDQLYVVSFAGAGPFRADEAADGSNTNAVYAPIYDFDAGIASVSSDDRNLVWLDRARSIVGQLSWSLTPIVGTDLVARDCGPAGCNVLTLFLDFPFRFDVTTDPLPSALSTIDGSPVETVTLQTIVGHRL